MMTHEELIEYGCEYSRREDAHGETRTGYWLDGVWLGRTPRAATESIIAQDDDSDYEESRYVVVKIGDWCAIGSYSHCSCYGTCDDDEPVDPNWVWQGTTAELIEMARRCADPAIPDRDADPDDCGYDNLQSVYRQVLEKLT